MLIGDDLADDVVEDREGHSVLERRGGECADPASGDVAGELGETAARGGVNVFEEEIGGVGGV